MPNCVICGAETPNRVACSLHIQLNSNWKCYNSLRGKRGLPPVTIEQYQEHRKRIKNKGFYRRPSIFVADDIEGPTVVWNGQDQSPCAQGCAHRWKDKARYGCVKCDERIRFEAVTRAEFYGLAFVFVGRQNVSLDFQGLTGG
jgi:hypothetical protein